MIDTNYTFHVAFDGHSWQCFETAETTRTENPLVPFNNPVFSADWDGMSSTLFNVIGLVPVNGIPFMGWPQA